VLHLDMYHQAAKLKFVSFVEPYESFRSYTPPLPIATHGSFRSYTPPYRDSPAAT